MKKKPVHSTRSKKIRTRVSLSKKKSWLNALPLKFSVISVTILGCLALLAGGVYHTVPQSQSDVLGTTIVVPGTPAGSVATHSTMTFPVKGPVMTFPSGTGLKVTIDGIGISVEKLSSSIGIQWKTGTTVTLILSILSHAPVTIKEPSSINLVSMPNSNYYCTSGGKVVACSFTVVSGISEQRVEHSVEESTRKPVVYSKPSCTQYKGTCRNIVLCKLIGGKVISGTTCSSGTICCE